MLTLLDLEPPSVALILPSVGSAGGFTLITVYGSSFSENIAEITVHLGGDACRVQSANMTHIVCITQPHLPGATYLMVNVQNIGNSFPSRYSSFEFLFDIMDISPRHVGVSGGLLVTAIGEGLIAGQGTKANISVVVPGWSVYVIGIYTAPR